MVFVAAGVILGPGGLDVLPSRVTNETVLTITELTLALLLFADASTVRLRDVEGDTGLPRRLLFVGLPLTIAAGALLAYLVFPEVGWAAAALLATILAPTDAALGLAVVTNTAVPVRIRRALNVESGLNDGIATPFVTLFIAAVAAEEALGETAWGLEALTQIGLAILAAVVVGYLGGKLLALANDRGWTSQVSEQIAILALALLAYQGSVTVGGNGSSPPSPVASCSGPPPEGVWRHRSSSPRPWDCRARSWCGRCSVRCSSGSCSPVSSQRNPSSTPC